MGLPSGYRCIEYIQSNGSQHINTGFKPTPKTAIELDFQMVSNADQQRLFANFSAGYEDSSELVMEVYTTDGAFKFCYQNAKPNWIATGVLVDTNRHKVKLDGYNKTFSLDSYSASLSGYTATNNGQREIVLLWTSWTDQGNHIKASARIYGGKIWDNGTLVRDFVPCINSSGTIGLYDLVNSKFYTNSGSGGFLAGYIQFEKTGGNALINGACYSVYGGTVLINGSAYSIFKGNTLVNGTVYEIGVVIPTYSISYELNGGSLSGSYPTSYNKRNQITLPTPTRTGYTFNGWYDNASFSGGAVTTIPSGNSGNKTYYAKWSINYYTIAITGSYNGLTAVHVNGTVYNNPTTLSVPYGTTVICSVAGTYEDRTYVALNGVKVASGVGESGNKYVDYYYTVTRNVSMELVLHDNGFRQSGQIHIYD